MITYSFPVTAIEPRAIVDNPTQVSDAGLALIQVNASGKPAGAHDLHPVNWATAHGCGIYAAPSVGEMLKPAFP